MENHHHLWEFFWSIFNNWAGYATSGIVAAIAWFWIGWRQQAMTRKILAGLCLCFLVMAVYKAWEDQYEKAEVAGKNSDDFRNLIKGYQARVTTLSDALLTASNRPPITGALMSNFDIHDNGIGILNGAGYYVEGSHLMRDNTYINVPPTQEIENKKFQYEVVVIDDKKFINCTFTRCKMIFLGLRPSQMYFCSASECIWTSPKPEIRDWTITLAAIGLLNTNRMVDLDLPIH